MNERIAAAKNFVNRHKTKVLVVGIAVTAAYAAALTRNKALFDDFLREHNLYDTYYTPEEN